MRKFFSLIAAVLFAGSMMAQVTITPSAITAAESTEISATIEGVSLNITQGTVTADQIRIFKNQTITISAESNITSIVFTCTANGAAKYGPGCFTAQEGYTYEAEGKTGTWTGSATSVSFEASANQVRASQIVVTLEGGEPVVVDTYTVAGNDAAIFGESWNPALTANDMTLADGVYTWAKAQLNLTAGTEIQFKVVKNHSWDIAYPAQNYVVNIAEAGEYTLTITFDPSTEAVAAEAVKKVIPQYEVAEAIAAGLAENDEILVRGVITKMEFKGKNFAKFGSVNIYVADATGAEGAFEFYNCYSLNADTFRTSTPAYDPESTAWVEFEEVADENGNAIHVGDTVIAFGKYKLYNETHELNTGCYLTEIKHPGDAPVEEDNVIYDWAGEIGTTVLGASGVEVTTVKIHTNTDAVPAIKFGSSFVYADGKWIAIKPAEGGFKAGDVLSLAAVFNNADDTKYAQVDLRAANGDTRIWMSDSASTINGRTSAAEPIVQTYTLEADQDSLFLGRYGNTGMFVTMLKVVREGGDVPPVEEHTYTVAGSSDVAFGTTWDPANTANDMALVEGLYTWEKSEQTLAAGNILFKVCEDHAWTNCWPSDNYELNIPEAGIYTITITFNEETKEVAANATKTGEAVVIPSVAMHGNFLGSWADTENFAIAQDNASASLTLTLAEGNYEFGMRIGGSGNWTANGANLTREANTTNLAEGSGNMHIAADVAGDYVFTYTYETQVLEVVYPEAPGEEINVTISSLTNPGQVLYADAIASSGYWDIYAFNDQYEIEISNISTTEAAGTYTIDDLDAKYTYIVPAEGDTVHFTAGQVVLSITDGVVNVAGKLTGDDNNIYNVNLTYKDPVAEQTVNVNIPKGVLYDGYATYGLYAVYGFAEDSTYVQLAIWAEQGFQGEFTEDDLDNKYVGSGLKDAAGNSQQIYTAAITVTPGNGEGVYSITADLLCYNNTLYKVTMKIGEEQGIEDVEAAVKAIKRLVNGQLVIEKAGKTYNATGAVIR